VKPNPPFDFAALRDRLQARTGLRFGWPTAADYTLHPHVVTLRGLSRADLGDRQFEFVFKAVRNAAARLAPADHLVEAVYLDHQRVGYEFRFRDALTAMRLRLCHAAAMRGRPSPLIAWGL
jgi:non-ribosomal peptide synthetase component F